MTASTRPRMTSGPRSVLLGLAGALVCAGLARGANLAKPTAVAEAPSAAQRQPSPGAPVAADPRIATHGDMTRLSFEISADAPVRAFALADPDRVVVELPEVNFQVDPATGRAPTQPRSAARRGKPAPPAAPLAGAVNSWRAGLFAPGKSRIVIDLAQPVRIARAVVEKTPEGGYRLVVEMTRIERAAFLASARQERVAQSIVPATPPAARETAGERPVVVLDAGHGGVDDGAHGPAGAMEKDIVLEFVRVLAARLEKIDKFRIVTTRSTDVFIPLGDRVKIARDAGAALFISIHADMLADEPKVSGATVYTVSEKASDAEAARVADKENQSDAIAGLDSREEQNEIAEILFDLTRRETRAYSNVFARTLVDYVKDVARLNKNSRRSAGFRVLKAPDVPSVLLEIGYLSSGTDAPNLVSPDWRDRTAGAVAQAVVRFFAARDASPARPGSKAENSDFLELKASFDFEASGPAR